MCDVERWPEAAWEATHEEYPDRLLSSPQVIVSVGDNLPAATWWIAHSRTVNERYISFIISIKVKY